MKDLMDCIKKYYLPTILAFLHFGINILFKIDRFFFDYPNINYTHMFFMKALSLIFLIFGWNFGFYVHRKIKDGDESFKRGLKFFLIHFTITTIVLLLVWPGLWAWDDVGVLRFDSKYEFFAWQHILTGVRDMLFLQILPFVGGIIFIQNTICVICTSFIIVKLEQAFNIYLKNKILDIVVKIAPFIFFPILRFQLGGYRIGLYIFIEAVMFCMLACAIKNKEKWDIAYSLLFILVSVITLTWRTESLVYLPFILLTLFVVPEIGRLKQRIVISLLIICGFWGLHCVQNKYLGNDNYKIVSTINTAVELIKVSNKTTDKDILTDIDKVLKIDILYQSLDIPGYVIAWDKPEFFNHNSTHDEYHAYLGALGKLIRKYPTTYLKERSKMFIESLAPKYVHGTAFNRIITLNARDIIGNPLLPVFDNLEQKSFLNKPVNRKLKKETAYFICLRRNNFLERIVWGIIPPLSVLTISGIILAVKRKWKYFILWLALFAKLGATIVSAPSPWYFYYLSFYIIGYVILAYLLMHIFTKERGTENA